MLTNQDLQFAVRRGMINQTQADQLSTLSHRSRWGTLFLVLGVTLFGGAMCFMIATQNSPNFIQLLTLTALPLVAAELLHHKNAAALRNLVLIISLLAFRGLCIAGIPLISSKFGFHLDPEFYDLLYVFNHKVNALTLLFTAVYAFLLACRYHSPFLQFLGHLNIGLLFSEILLILFPFNHKIEILSTGYHMDAQLLLLCLYVIYALGVALQQSDKPRANSLSSVALAVAIVSTAALVHMFAQINHLPMLNSHLICVGICLFGLLLFVANANLPAALICVAGALFCYAELTQLRREDQIMYDFLIAGFVFILLGYLLYGRKRQIANTQKQSPITAHEQKTEHPEEMVTTQTPQRAVMVEPEQEKTTVITVPEATAETRSDADPEVEDSVTDQF